MSVTLTPDEFPVPGDPCGISWHANDVHGGFVVVCGPCGYQSKLMEHSRALTAVRQHINKSRSHWWRRGLKPPPRKRATPAHMAEMGDEEMRAEMRRTAPAARLEQRDAQAVAEGWPRNGAFRPGYTKHVRELAERSGDGEITGLLDRLEELAAALHAAREEDRELREAMREWLSVAELIDREHV